jgi:hypothetical protein
MSYNEEVTEAQYYFKVTVGVISLILATVLAIMLVIKMGTLLFPHREVLKPIDWGEYDNSKCEIKQSNIVSSCNHYQPKSYELDKETGCITKVECE